MGDIPCRIGRHRGVRDRRHGLPHRNARMSYPPPTVRLAMATPLRPPVVIRLNRGLLELPLILTFPARIRRLWFADRSSATWAAGQPGAVVGAFAVSGVLHNVGMWGLGAGHGVFHCW